MASKDLEVGGAIRWEEPGSLHHCSPNTGFDFMKMTTKLQLCLAFQTWGLSVTAAGINYASVTLK